MAEAVGLAASVIAIIDLSAKVAVLCLDYSTAVGNARADITRLRSRLYDLGTTLQGVRRLLDDPSSQALATSRRLVDSVDACTSELAQLQSRLDPGKARKAMRRFGIRALKWPFDSKEVAIQFAHHIRDTSPQTSVFWVHASSKPRFEEAYRSIADNLRLPRRNEPSVNVLGLVRDWLQREEAGPWLMVLDNVDDVNLFYRSSSAGRDGAVCHPADENPAALSVQRPLAVFLPKCRNGIILVTSRSMDAAEKLTGSHKAVYGISAMDDAQALQLFRNKLQGDSDKTAAADLLRALDYIPLAITQAAAYINRRAPRISVKTYLDAFRASDKKKGSLLNSDAGDLRRDETVSNSVVTTWQVTLEQIRRERPSAANLLSLMSFFNPQGIPEFALHNYNDDLTENADGVKDDEENDEFEDDLDVLRGYSLVSVTAKRDVCEMHALVQFCTRVWLSVVDNADRWKRLFLWAMSRHFPNGTFETWPTCQMLLPHIESILEEEPPEKDREQWAYLLTNCAWYLATTGSYRAAEKLGEKAVKTRANVLGEVHPHTLASMYSLASTFRNQGRWKEAEELQVRVMETSLRVLGEEHHDTLASMNDLASTFRNQGQWKEAEELQVRVIETMKTVLGEGHLGTLGSMNNLTVTYMNQGRWKEAEELQVRVMETIKNVLGEQHPDTLTSMANLASTFGNQGRWKEAEELEVRVMETRKTVLGEDHPDTLTSMNNLTVTYMNQGRWKEAEELQVRVMETIKNVLGEGHPDTLASMNSLASTFGNQGRWKEAEELDVRVMETRKNALGEQHPDTLTSMANLASTYWNQGRWKEAEELEVRVMETRKTVLGEDHPDTLTSMNNLAIIWKDQGRYRDALALMRNCVALRERVLGMDHPDAASSAATLANWEEASDLS
ncbi:hypothetical protein AUP68_10380 [Ilyonectria robusta]